MEPLEQEVIFFIFSGRRKKPHLHLHLFAKSQNPLPWSVRVLPSGCCFTCASYKIYMGLWHLGQEMIPFLRKP